MKKQLLTIEFRYNDAPKSDNGSTCVNKTITVGIYDTIAEAVDAGNESLIVLAEHFQVRPNDKFKVNGLFGFPDRLVTNTCYPTKGVQYFAQIKALNFDDLDQTIADAFKASQRYRDYKISQND